MKDFTDKDTRIVGIFTILSGLLACGSMLTGLIATNFDPKAFSNPILILHMESATPAMIKWFMLLDMFGYYLLLMPVILLMHQRLKKQTPWATLITFSGYSYVIIGAIGAAMLAATWPALITSFREATPAEQPLHQALFLMSNQFVVKGIWNVLEMFLAGVWWLGLSQVAASSRSLRATTLTLGVACLADGTGEIFGLPLIADIGLNIYLLLAIVWAIWTGVAMLRPLPQLRTTPAATRA